MQSQKFDKILESFVSNLAYWAMMMFVIIATINQIGVQTTSLIAIMGSIITNYSANDTRRVDLTIGVSYDDDIDKVRSTLQDLIDADERVFKDPAPLIAVSELADSSVNFTVRIWVNSSDYSAVKYGLTEAIKKRFDKEGISFPYPQRDVHLIKS